LDRVEEDDFLVEGVPGVEAEGDLGAGEGGDGLMLVLAEVIEELCEPLEGGEAEVVVEIGLQEGVLAAEGSDADVEEALAVVLAGVALPRVVQGNEAIPIDELDLLAH
jgi:hypothetical protein